MKLSSAAYLEGYYYKPRVDWELLERYHEGLIATTGCLGGVVLQALLAGRRRRGDASSRPGCRTSSGATASSSSCRTTASPNSAGRTRCSIEIAKRIGAPLARDQRQPLLPARGRRRARRAALRADRGDDRRPEALQVRRRGALPEDARRRCAQLFAELPGGLRQHAVDRRAGQRRDRARQADAARSSPSRSEFRRADYDDVGDGLPAPPHLRGRARSATATPLPPRSSSGSTTSSASSTTMGFPAYFLVVWDLIRHAREREHPGRPGPGSAAGCCVAYCLRIVDLDPIRYDLLFERFLNPGRKQMPDIDMDFDERYRGEMIRYATERYGWDHVAQIVTFSTIKARAAVRDAARVLGYPYALGDRIAKAMPPLVMGRDTPLGACLEQVRGLRGRLHGRGRRCARCTRPTPTRSEVIDVARGLEGLRRQDGIHAAAVVITHEPLTEYLPIQRKPEPGARSGRRADRHPVRDARRRGARPAEDGLPRPAQPLGDRDRARPHRGGDRRAPRHRRRPARRRAHLRDAAPRRLDRRLPARGRPDALADALARADDASTTSPRSSRSTGPGPMAANMHRDYADRKNGRKPVTYLHPDLEPILGDTYGLMIYQESVMRVAQRFAGYTLEEADNLRKACGKKIRALIAARAGEVRRRLRRRRATARRSAPSCSTSSSRSPTTPSTSPTPTATASSPTRRPG